MIQINKNCVSGVCKAKDFKKEIKVLEKITSKNYQEVIDGYNMTEYGTTNIKMIMEMEGF